MPRYYPPVGPPPFQAVPDARDWARHNALPPNPFASPMPIMQPGAVPAAGPAYGPLPPNPPGVVVMTPPVYASPVSWVPPSTPTVQAPHALVAGPVAQAPLQSWNSLPTMGSLSSHESLPTSSSVSAVEWELVKPLMHPGSPTSSQFVFDHFKVARDRNMPLQEATLDALMSNMAGGSLPALSDEVLRYIRAWGPPTTHQLTQHIKACVRSSRPDLAMRTFERMRDGTEADASPAYEAYALVINLCCQRDDYDLAEQLLEEIRTLQIACKEGQFAKLRRRVLHGRTAKSTCVFLPAA